MEFGRCNAHYRFIMLLSKNSNSLTNQEWPNANILSLRPLHCELRIERRRRVESFKIGMKELTHREDEL